MIAEPMDRQDSRRIETKARKAEAGRNDGDSEDGEAARPDRALRKRLLDDQMAHE